LVAPSIYFSGWDISSVNSYKRGVLRVESFHVIWAGISSWYDFTLPKPAKVNGFFGSFLKNI
jgi:hypothetical protein